MGILSSFAYRVVHSIAYAGVITMRVTDSMGKRCPSCEVAPGQRHLSACPRAGRTHGDEETGRDKGRK